MTLLFGGQLCAQLSSTNYRASDNGSVTHGGLATSANVQNAIVNVWWAGHTYGSTNYQGQSNVPGGFTFPCSGAGQPVITQSGDTLFSSPGVSYQWYYNGVLINGATSHFLIATLPGNYSVVIVDDKGCTLSSAQFAVGIEALSIAFGVVRVFPVPTAGTLSVEWEGVHSGLMTVTVVNLMGEIMLDLTVKVVQDNGIVQLDLSALPQGIYLIRLRNDQGELSRAIVKG